MLTTPLALVSSKVTASKLKKVDVGPPDQAEVVCVSQIPDPPPVPVQASEAGMVPLTTKLTNAGVAPFTERLSVNVCRAPLGRPRRLRVGAGFASIVAPPPMT